MFYASNSAFAQVSPAQEAINFVAVRFGQPDAVRLILEEFSSLALQPNMAGDIPLIMAKDLLADVPNWQDHMRRQNRRTGVKADFEAIIVLLEAASL
ncbi:MAG: hypothetical protein JWP96_2380 [Polaromonas sp.]|nr:hypothetical protein [Polaromonas sp.]